MNNEQTERVGRGRGRNKCRNLGKRELKYVSVRRLYIMLFLPRCTDVENGLLCWLHSRHVML